MREAQSDFHIPTIDISKALSDAHLESPSLRQIVDNIHRACTSSGFFQIKGHGIPSGQQRAVFDAAARFFALPEDEKLKLDCKKMPGFRGYDALATQAYHEGVLPDLKESFLMGIDVPESHPHHGRFFCGRNAWPPTDMLPAGNFRQPCEAYYKSIQSLTVKVLELVGISIATHAQDETRAESLQTSVTGTVPPPVVHDLAYSSDVPACPLRLLHYPAQYDAETPVDKPQYGASAHTDFGAITLLLQDENPGLEVFDAATGTWRLVNPDPDAYVVNIGDMISRVTGGLYKSTLHRVVCSDRQKERYSIPFFFNGCLDAKLVPINGPEKRGDDGVPPLTVEQHLLERIRMSYSRVAKDAQK